MSKKTVLDFLDMKRRGEKITFLTAYDYPLASFAEKAGIDMMLVGDSLGMVVYGLPGTIPVTMDEMIIHSRAVRRGAPNTFVIGDMPFMSYQSSVEKAVENAGRFLKEAEMDAIKLEGGRRVKDQIKAIVDAGIPVMGHIGLTPQSSGQLGGFKAQGRTADAAGELLLDAIAIEEAGAFSILLEAIPPEVGGAITERLSIPTLGIGAGINCDGQLLISGDMLGLVEAFTPKFVKKYVNLSELITKAIAEYISDIKEMQFPEEKHTYRMKEGEVEKLQGFLKSLDR
ncbi:MAG: 3-methyl-2-oxobutanoate hydroxymethyltransferase [Firmicutes bacterium]|nr:3-methyl-2-oxobutanoate hydroxymethyltransferase [Bacillota bacterium]HXL05073.1 3-methyl-2-oxobutanoate hydroxymethyltransferase [Bacillota bacterium]